MSEPSVMGQWALRYAEDGFEVFPLRAGDKRPLRACAPCWGEPGKPKCPGPEICGHELCHGAKDATRDLAVIRRWWERFPASNIGIRVPRFHVVIDTDPRSGGHRKFATLATEHGGWPETLTVITGGPAVEGQKGLHLWYRTPDVQIAAKSLAPIDIKTPGSYVVAPPSTHPDSGDRYAYVGYEAKIADAPAWLLGHIVRREDERARITSGRACSLDPFARRDAAGRTFASVLEPQGWVLAAGDGESDGSAWLHPNNPTSKWSATVRVTGGVARLYVYSPNAHPLLDVTTDDDPRGHSVIDLIDIYEGRTS